MDDMLKEFVVEALELATNVEEHLLSLERNPDDLNTLNAVFRSFHTIKGGAGFMNLGPMVSACHLTENLFDALRNGQVPVTPIAIEAALQASGFVADQLTELANGTSADALPAMPASLEAILTSAIEGNAAAPASAPAAAAPATAAAAAPAVDDNGIDWNALYLAVVPTGTALPAQAVTPSAAPATAAAAAPAKGAPAKGDWDGADRRAGGGETRAASVKEDSIRIDAVKLDTLLEVAGESVQAANQAAVLVEKLAQFPVEGPAAALMAALQETLSRASRYSTELQRATLSTRMQPVGKLFQRFPRLVRELAKDLGKDVDLQIEGAETEVDRVVVDSLYDPLVHMLRNSLDHGIEDGATRAAAGKPSKSLILLKAWQEASSVMIEISDDGKGMDPQQLRAKAVSKGLISDSAPLTPEECLQLVFLPGFSTKEVANSVSGRGVGMDVVKTAVEKHRGAITIDSKLGAGTRFSIRLPIELSIVPTMLVRSGDAALALPMAVVQRVVELPDEFDQVGGAPVLRDQGRPLPVRSLACALGYEVGEEKVGIVIAAPQPYIISVGAVDGTADLVIKPMTALSVAGIAGTARSAEGELVLVLGLSFLLDGCRATARLAA
jgi:two-component system chemotaxis sensor kinase CheA